MALTHQAGYKAMTSGTPRTYLVDDHWVALAGLTDFLTDSGIEVTGSAQDAASVIEHCRAYPDDAEEIIILDLSVDESGGEATFRAIRQARPGARVLVLSMRESLSIIRHMYWLGADGYVTKTATPEETIRAVRTIWEGKRFYMEGIAEQLLEADPAEVGVDPREALTQLEIDLVRRVAQGYSPDAIADQLQIKRKTVHNRTRTIRHKLGHVAHADLGWIARKYGLVNLDL